MNDEINRARYEVERLAVPHARRIASAAVHQHYVPGVLTERLAGSLERSLAATARFGFESAQAEVVAHRRILAHLEILDVGDHPETAGGGLAAIRRLIHRRARRSAELVASAVIVDSLSPERTSGDLAATLAATVTVAKRKVHLHVLELVGETLNLGRTAGVLALPTPPEFALRSEQLDKNTCPACERLHGTIEQIGTDAFWSTSPPTGCYGGGRCRAIWVYGDSYADVSLPRAA